MSGRRIMNSHSYPGWYEVEPRGPREDADFVFNGGLAFPKAMSCGNYKTPRESPYGYGPHIVAGPIKTFTGKDIVCDYDDRLRQFYPDKWDGAFAKLEGQRLKHATTPARSAFLSHLYGFEVESLQVIEGCNVSNGYPYLIFISRRLETQEHPS